MTSVCDIILLSWNKLHFIKPCVESIYKHTTLPIRLLIVDNGSEAETKSYLKSLEQGNVPSKNENISLEIIFNSDNKGFVGGMNQGMKWSTAPVVCLLNNDTLVTPNWLELCLKAFEQNPQIGVLNPNSSTFGVWPKKNQSVEDVAASLEKQYALDPVTEIGCCVGFCMFIKKEVKEKIGYLEESLYKIFFEDTDFCKRAKRAGYLCAVANQAYVFHHEHGTLSKKSEREVYFLKNREWFYKKWGKPLRIFWPKKTLTEKDREILTQLAREDHFIHVPIPSDLNILWKPHAHIAFIKHSTRWPILYFAWKILKKRKKKYDVVVTEDFPKLHILHHISAAQYLSTVPGTFLHSS